MALSTLSGVLSFIGKSAENLEKTSHRRRKYFAEPPVVRPLGFMLGTMSIVAACPGSVTWRASFVGVDTLFVYREKDILQSSQYLSCPNDSVVSSHTLW